ncbi:MSC domain-containing protein [Heracleum sosnowskyi]|uniref:MSC domain-containing protein n=1 Tax=Heracleum sosnowskyi TaxID=360622 RepID=A0AAD8I4R2_9APIA|nr:MSC domain-containing protein [Heracleum sosnowskyi]
MASFSTPPKKRSRPKQRNPSSSILTSLEPSSNLFPSNKSEFVKLLALVTIASFVAFSSNYVINLFNRHPIPFCDDSLHDLDLSLSDICTPCPTNGVCHQGKLECASGYRKLGTICVEDGDINQTAKKLLGSVEAHVCEAYAQNLCHGTGKVWAAEDVLWNNLEELKLMEHYGLDTSIYVLAKQRAVQTVGQLLETRVSSNGIRELKCPDSLVKRYKSVSCYIRQWITEHAVVLVLISAVLLVCLFVLIKVQRSHHLSVRAEELYKEVCDILEDTALKSRSVNGEVEPWIVVSWLRDHLLSPKERKNPLLWKKVEDLVQEDSRLDRYPKMVKGESKVVWEWQVEGPLSSSGKEKKREGGLFKRSIGTILASDQTPRTQKAGHPLYS